MSVAYRSLRVEVTPEEIRGGMCTFWRETPRGVVFELRTSTRVLCVGAPDDVDAIWLLLVTNI